MTNTFAFLFFDAVDIILQMYPSCSEIRYLCGCAYVLVGQRGKAMVEMNQAIISDRSNTGCYTLRALINGSRGNYNQAYRDAEFAIKNGGGGRCGNIYLYQGMPPIYRFIYLSIYISILFYSNLYIPFIYLLLLRCFTRYPTRI